MNTTPPTPRQAAAASALSEVLLAMLLPSANGVQHAQALKALYEIARMSDVEFEANHIVQAGGD